MMLFLSKTQGGRLTILLIPLLLDIVLPCSGVTQTGAARSGELNVQPSKITCETQDLDVPSPLCLLRTRDGFFWVTNPEGLYRYDGFDLVPFRHPLGLADSKHANWMTALIEDHAGDLWLGSRRGLNRFDRETESLTRYLIDPSKQADPGANYVRCLIEDREGSILLGAGSLFGSHGCYRFDRETEAFTLLPDDSGSRMVVALCEDRKGDVWAGTLAGIHRLDRETGHFVPFRGDDQALAGLSSDTVIYLFEDRGNNLWVGTIRGLVRISPSRAEGRRYTESPGIAGGGPVTATAPIVEDSRGVLWVGTWGEGLYRYDARADCFLRFPSGGELAQVALGDTIVGLAEGRNLSGDRFRSSIWISSFGRGLQKLVVQYSPITEVQGFARRRDSWVVAVTADCDNIVWAATRSDGLYRLDLESRRYQQYLQLKSVTRIMRTNRGNLIVQAGPNPYLYDEQSDSFSALFKDTLWLEGESRDGSLWFGTLGASVSLVRYDPRKDSLTRFPRSPPESDLFFDENATGFLEDRDGVIWFGTFGGGLTRFDPGTGHYKRFLAQPDVPGGLRHNTVMSILEDDEGVLWLGTHGGLHSLDRTSEQFTFYPSPESDRDIFIRSMVADGKGNLWLSSNRNVVCFRRHTRDFLFFGKHEGLARDASYFGIAYERNAGTIALGEAGRIWLFSPDSLLALAASTSPTVVLTEFNIFDKPAQLPLSISRAKEVVLAHSDNFFSFKFAVLDFVDPSRNRYAYKLEGFDRDWQYPFDRRSAYYTNVEPGAYLFRVKGCNSVGVWNEEGASVRVVVTPPWWKTTWAYMGYATVAAVLLFGLYQYDRKRTALRHELQMEKFSAEKLREIDEMKMRFFANVSHEFRTPLTLLLGPAEQLLEKLRDPEDWTRVDVIRRSGRRLLELVNQLLDISKLDAGRMKLRVEPIELVRFLRGLVFSFASLAERKQIGLRFDGPEKEVIVAYIDRDKVQKILVNLLSNAFKFTPEGGEIRVAVGVAEGGSEGRVVEIAVSDSGAGIAAEKLEKIFQRFYQVDDSHVREHEGAGIGLSLTKELVELHRGEISVQSEPGRGSTFRVRLPFGKEQWKEEEIVEPVEGAGEVSVRPPVILEDEPVLREEEKPEEGGPEPLVLIVEDNADVRAYVRGSLVPEYRVLEAEDGRGGLEAASSVMPDLIVSDIMMPHIDGIELCRRVKSDERTSHIPVILLTARASDAGKLEGLETGADDYIIKPFDMQELQARIRNLIDLRRKLQEKYRRQCMLEPGDIPLESVDEKFLRKALEVVEAHLSDVDFDNTAFARELCMSRMQLNRKLQALTGRSIHEFIRRLRLQRAAKLLSSHWGNVTEVAYEVGFNSLSSFARSFREHYGVPPSEFMTHPVDS